MPKIFSTQLTAFANTLFAALISAVGFAQVSSSSINGTVTEDRMNPITTAVPFLMITPDARHGGMGDAGVASSADFSATHWNNAKVIFAPDKMAVGMAYTPWLRNLVPDINLSYLSGYYKLNKMVAITSSLRYFSLGDIQFTDEFGNETRQFRPNEFALDAGVSAKLSKVLSGGVAFRFINSNLTGGTDVQGANTKPGRMVAADLSLFYNYDKLKIADKKAEIRAGLAISNIGGKMSYSSSTQSDFLPTNMRIGPSFTYHIDDYNSLTLNVDLNKLLVPTSPIYKVDSAGNPIPDGNGFQIGAGKDPNRPVLEGMFTSFSDAPGNPLRDDQGNYIINSDGFYEVEKGSKFREELREVNISVGMEYWYDKLFALRAGYFYENPLKGNRKFITLGAGFRYNVFGFDFSYLVPAYFGKNVQQSPLQNTMRFSLILNFSASKSGTGEGKSDIPTN
jgi:hypothetical protein